MNNPFRGPQQLQPEDELFGRDAELQELSHLLMARRILLFYSPSGAGKSSLLQTKNGLIARMRKKPWSMKTWPVARVNLSADGAEGNRFVRSAISSFEEGFAGQDERREEMLSLTLAEYAKRRVEGPVLLVFDQFEEILRIDPQDTAAKRQFFDELGEMLTDSRIWAVFSMREDYLAPLDRYRRLIPTYLENRFRLDLLRADMAEIAIGKTAASSRPIEEKALGLLMLNLADSSGEDGKAAGYVEPLQLQVVCRNLWATKAGADGEPSDTITVIDEAAVRESNPARALAIYYEQSVKDAAAKSGNPKPLREEYRIRAWIAEELISSSGARKQIRESDADLNPASLKELIDSHILRREERQNHIWLELSHDRLVAPIRESNAEQEKDLPQYYGQAVKEAVERSGSSTPARTEYEIREWIEEKLISPAGAIVAVPNNELVPKPATAAGESDAAPESVVVPAAECLEDLVQSGILRRDLHDRRSWLRLSHDRLVVPVRESNEEWRKDLDAWEKRARSWEGEKQERLRPTHLARGRQFRKARKWAKAHADSRVDLTAWLAACRKRQNHRRKIAATGLAGLGLAAFVIGSFAYWALSTVLNEHAADIARSSMEDADADGDPEQLIQSAVLSLDAMRRTDDVSRMTVLHGVEAGLGRLEFECTADNTADLPAPALSPDGSAVFLGAGKNIVRCDRSHEKGWRLSDGFPVEFRRLVASQESVAGAMTDGNHLGLLRWDGKAWSKPKLLPAADKTDHVAISTSGLWMAGFGEGGLTLYRVGQNTGEPVRVETPVRGAVSAVALSERWIVIGQGTRVLWLQLPDGASGGQTSGEGSADLGDDAVQTITIAPDEHEAILGAQAPSGRVFRLSLPAGKLQKEPRQFYDAVLALRYRKDGKTVLAGIRRANAPPGMVNLEGQPVLPLPGGGYYQPDEDALKAPRVTKAAFSADGGRVAIVNSSQTSVFSAPAGNAPPSFPAFPCRAGEGCDPEYRRKLDHCHLSADSKSALCMVGSRMEKLFGGNAGIPREPVKAGIDDFAISANGRYTVLATAQGLARVDLTSGASVAVTGPGKNGKIPADYEYAISDDGNVVLYNASDGVHVFDLRSHRGQKVGNYTAMAPGDAFLSIDSKGERAVVGYRDDLQRFDLTSLGSEPDYLDGSQLTTQIIKVDPKGQALVLAREDGRVRILSLNTEKWWSLQAWVKLGELADDFSIPLALGERLEDVGFDGTELVGLIRDWSGARRLTRTQLDRNELAWSVCYLIGEEADQDVCERFVSKAQAARKAAKK